VNQINRALKETQGKAEEKCATSYSFRRNFVQRTIQRYTDDEGWVNWAMAAKLTAHINIEVLRNKYTEQFGNTL